MPLKHGSLKNHIIINHGRITFYGVVFVRYAHVATRTDTIEEFSIGASMGIFSDELLRYKGEQFEAWIKEDEGIEICKHNRIPEKIIKYEDLYYVDISEVVVDDNGFLHSSILWNNFDRTKYVNELNKVLQGEKPSPRIVGAGIFLKVAEKYKQQKLVCIQLYEESLKNYKIFAKNGESVPYEIFGPFYTLKELDRLLPQVPFHETARLA